MKALVFSLKNYGQLFITCIVIFHAYLSGYYLSNIKDTLFYYWFRNVLKSLNIIKNVVGSNRVETPLWGHPICTRIVAFH